MAACIITKTQLSGLNYQTDQIANVIKRQSQPKTKVVNESSLTQRTVGRPRKEGKALINDDELEAPAKLKTVKRLKSKGPINFAGRKKNCVI